MRIVCPYTPAGLRPETRAALEATGRPVEFRDVSADDFAYGRLVAELWAAGLPFLLAEQDIVAPVAYIEALEACHGRICCAPFPYRSTALGDRLVTSFGFARFSAAILAAYPTLPAGIGPRPWYTLDDAYFQALAALGVPTHVHARPVEHLGWERPREYPVDEPGQPIALPDGRTIDLVTPSAVAAFRAIEAEWRAAHPIEIMATLDQSPALGTH